MATKKTNKRSAVKAGKRKPGAGLVDMTGRGRIGVNTRSPRGADLSGGNQPRKPGSAGRRPARVTSKK